MSVEFDSESPGKVDSRTLSRETLSRWTGRIIINIIIIIISISIIIMIKLLYCMYVSNPY